MRAKVVNSQCQIIFTHLITFTTEQKRNLITGRETQQTEDDSVITKFNQEKSSIQLEDKLL